MSADVAPLDKIYARVSRRILPILLLGYIVAYLDRVNVGFAKLQMLQDLHFSEVTYGLGAGIFFIGYFLFEVPSNVMLHRFGARVWISRIMISWGVISAAMMFVTTPTTFYVLRFFLGVAEAGFFPGIILYLTQWFPPQRRGKATALFMTGIAISSTIGSLLSGWIMQTFDGAYELGGWQWLFVLEALPAIALGAYVFFRLDDRISSASWLSADEKVILSAEIARCENPDAARSFGDAFRDGRVWFGCLIYFCSVTGIYGISFWLPTVISDLGVKGPMDIGMLTAIPYAAGAVVMVAVGRSADRHGERRWHLAIPATVGALGLVVSVLASTNVVLAIVALTFATAGVLTVPPLFWSISTVYLHGAAAAAGIAIINSFGNLAGFVAPYLIGWVKNRTGSTAVGLCIIAGFVFAAGVLVLAGTRPMKRLPGDS